jgi:ketosteroid isomerase-like protein
MRYPRLFAALAFFFLASLTYAQTVIKNPNPPPTPKSSFPEADPKLAALLESKIKEEWEAFRKRDNKAYEAILADDFIAVEDDAQGARNKTQSANEVLKGLVYNYTLFAFKAFSLCENSAFVRYEVSIQFPPKTQGHMMRIYVTEIWVKQGNEWKSWHYQDTKVK